MDTSYVVLAIVSFVAILIWAYIVVTSKDFPHMTDEEIAAGDQEFQDSLVDDKDTEPVVKEVKRKSPGKLTVAIEKVREATPEKEPPKFVPKAKKNPVPRKSTIVDKTPVKKVSRKKKGS